MLVCVQVHALMLPGAPHPEFPYPTPDFPRIIRVTLLINYSLQLKHPTSYWTAIKVGLTRKARLLWLYKEVSTKAQLFADSLRDTE